MFRTARFVLALIGLLLILGGIGFIFYFWGARHTPTTATTTEQWPIFHGNPQRTGFVSSVFADNPKPLWAFTKRDARQLNATENIVSAVIINNNWVFFSLDRVVALELKSGKFIWEYKDQDTPFYPGGLAAGDGKIFAVVNDSSLMNQMQRGALYVLNEKDGNFLWKYNFSAPITHSTPLYAEQKLFLSDDSATVYAFDPKTGQIIWQKKLSAETIHSSPAFYDNKVLIGSEGSARTQTMPSALIALDGASGAELWKFEIDYRPNAINLVHSTPAISEDVVYFGSENGFFYALDAQTGTQLWRVDTLVAGQDGMGESSSPALGYDKIFISTWQKYIALDQKTGAMVWEKEYAGQGSNSSGVVIDKKICWGSGETEFVCMRTDSGETLWSKPYGAPSAAAAEGILVVPNHTVAAESNDEEVVLAAFK